jgi:hypothetical protein
MAGIEIVSEVDCAVPTPVRFTAPGGVAALRDEATGRTLAAQKDGAQFVALVPRLEAGKKARLTFLERAETPAGVTTRDDPGKALEIALPEGPFSTYHYGPDAPRPFLFPVLGPGGKAVTRSYPMKDVPGEAKDHPHHRSFWTAYGEVNGVDDWSEAAGKHGFIRHRKFEAIEGGPVFGGFLALAQWQGPDGKALLDERRGLRVYNVGPEYRLLDYEVQLIAAHGPVHYGDTKEGGILAFRVATTMDGNKGGKMENGNGQVGEKMAWGKRAAWLDYSGPTGGETLGIGMMDHPGNLNHPCYWHARDYGLVGTNPFARASFEPVQPKTGHNQAAGETLRFRYRVLIHKGDARAGNVDDAYHAWIMAPRVAAI